MFKYEESVAKLEDNNGKLMPLVDMQKLDGLHHFSTWLFPGGMNY